MGGTDQRMLAKMHCGSGTVPCLGLFLPYLLAMSPVGIAPEVGGTDHGMVADRRKRFRCQRLHLNKLNNPPPMIPIPGSGTIAKP